MILVGFLAGVAVESFWGAAGESALAMEGNGRSGLETGNAGPPYERLRLGFGRDEAPLARGEEMEGWVVVVIREYGAAGLTCIVTVAISRRDAGMVRGERMT